MQQTAHDFDALPLAHGHAVHQARRIHRQTIPMRHLGNARRKGRRSDTLIQGQRNVFRHGQGFEQGEVLEYHADTETPRLDGTMNEYPATFPIHTAAVGPYHAIDDFHERALAGAVFADQGMNLPDVHTQIDMIVRDQGGVAFGDAVQLQTYGFGWVAPAHQLPR